MMRNDKIENNLFGSISWYIFVLVQKALWENENILVIHFLTNFLQLTH